MGEGPVYKVQAEAGDKTIRVLSGYLLLAVNDLPLEHDKETRPVEKNLQRERKADSREMAENESDASDEEEYSYRLQTIPVYEKRQVRSETAQSEEQCQLRVSARGFQPIRREAVEQAPVVTSQWVRDPEQSEACPVEEFREEPEVDNANQRVLLEVEDESDADQPGGEELTVRRSARTARPREMFTYYHLGKPSYQPWRLGANAVSHITPSGQ